jgi:glycosyltransferase involved in cell wall biosynthesis
MRHEGYVVVSTLGRLTIQKGLAHFMRSAARASHLYDKFLFVVAGDGEQRDELIRLSADYGIADKVLFTGFVRGEAWRQLYGVTDIFVMSSISEPFGLTALEAAAHDTAVVVTKQSGVSEVLKNILRYDYWDEVKLADQLINIAVSPALKSDLQTGAYNEFRTMSWDDVATRCMLTYQNVRSFA